MRTVIHGFSHFNYAMLHHGALYYSSPLYTSRLRSEFPARSPLEFLCRRFFLSPVRPVSQSRAIFCLLFTVSSLTSTYLSILSGLWSPRTLSLPPSFLLFFPSFLSLFVRSLFERVYTEASIFHLYLTSVLPLPTAKGKRGISREENRRETTA